MHRKKEMAATTRPKERRWLRFSLRTVLLVITLGALLLGWRVSQVRRQQAAVARIVEAGGSVRYRFDRPRFGQTHESGRPILTGPAWMRRLMGDEGFQVVHAVDLPGTRKDQELMELISSFRQLEALAAYGGHLCDRDLRHLARLTELRRLCIDSHRITDRGLVHLAGLHNLETLDLRHARLTDEGLRHLAAMTQMEVLFLDSPRITDAGLAGLRPMGRLRLLDLSGCGITDIGVEQLTRFTQLDSLMLGGTKVSDAGLSHLRRLTALRDLRLSGTSITDRGLEHVAALDGLDRLFLDDTKITDAGLRRLKRLKNLMGLSLINCRGITEAGVTELKRAIPGLLVNRPIDLPAGPALADR